MQHNRKSDDINILLLGQTGVGKSTFINAFANYLIYNNLDNAMNGSMQVLLPSSFTFTDPDTFEMTTINIGEKNDREKHSEIGESSTKICQSFVFPIGHRYLRLIDTPGIGDTRGLEQDSKNFENILAYISQYEHVNGICILFKPNEVRLSILFRFCIKELLRHLHITARENLMFIFTNSRASFYKPGSTLILIKTLLNDLYHTTNIKIPFSKENTFLFDNESFRFLAAYKNNIEFSLKQIEEYKQSWHFSINQFENFITYLITRPLHALKDTLSLNEAQQLIRKLTRPIAEITTLIEENIQLAKNHAEDVLLKDTDRPELMLQKDAEVISLSHPRTVCTSNKCTQVVIIDGIDKVDYVQHCHPRCYIRGIEQEVIHHPSLQHCDAMDEHSGVCTICGCHWSNHMHITYEYRKRLIYVKMKNMKNEDTILAAIEKRIVDLKEEEISILKVYSQLSKFLYKNTITPINDDLIDYINHFIQEEQKKQDIGIENAHIIDGLEKLKIQYKQEIDLFKKTLDNSNISTDSMNNIQTEDIFTLVMSLYQLPINGRKIREQVEGLKITEMRISEDREQFVQLPREASESKIMIRLKEILN